jgi:hypothetical protein
MKPLIFILCCAASAFAQDLNDKFTIPDFKVTEQTLARALPKDRPMFLYPPQLRNGPLVTVFKSDPVCLAMRSYRFDMKASPKLVSETTCTLTSRNGFLRVRR